MFFPGMAVISFRIVSRIGHQGGQSNSDQGLVQERPELRHVRLGATSRAERQDEVRLNIADHAQLGIAVIGYGFPGPGHTSPTTHE
jgi:hypothetical protein